jgi:ribonuclease J
MSPKHSSKKKSSYLRFVPIGGVGEVTKNMYLYETERDLVIVDCGIGFPDESEENEILIPDFSYLLKRSKKVRGLILTHGHEDHYGAVPYLLNRLKIPVYASPLAAGLAKAKIKERGPKKAEVKAISEGKTVKLGDFSFEFIHLTHSVPDTMAVALKTPLGTVIHTGDFKLDPTPLDRRLSELGKIGAYGDRGVLLLVSDSLRADREGSCPSERIVGETFFREIGKSKGRVFITLFSSDISRVQQAIDVSQALDRKITLAGFSIEKTAEIARSLGYLKIPKGMVVSNAKAKKLPQGKVVVLAAGSQGQENSALSKMVRGRHRFFKIGQGDLVLFSSDLIPGNEENINTLIGKLKEKKIKVLYLEEIPDIHVSGHGYAEDLKKVILLAKARFLIPIGGTPDSTKAYAKLAGGLNYPKGQILLLKNGEVLEFSRKKGKPTPRIAETLSLREVVVIQD